jgi:hypothetical protein
MAIKKETKKKVAKTPKPSLPKPPRSPDYVTGRPTKYDPSYNQIALDLFKEGASKVEVAARFMVLRGTLDEWAKHNPAFSDTLKIGMELSQGWWENQGRTSLKADGLATTEKINHQLWRSNMSCRFRNDWTEKKELDVTSNATVKVNFVDFADRESDDEEEDN